MCEKCSAQEHRLEITRHVNYTKLYINFPQLLLLSFLHYENTVDTCSKQQEYPGGTTGTGTHTYILHTCMYCTTVPVPHTTCTHQYRCTTTRCTGIPAMHAEGCMVGHRLNLPGSSYCIYVICSLVIRYLSTTLNPYRVRTGTCTCMYVNLHFF